MTMASNIETDERGLLVSCPQCGKRNRMAYDRLGQTFRCGQCRNDLSPPAEPVVVTGEAAFDALVGISSWPVLTDFWASWCGPCKMVEPELVKVAHEGAGHWLIAKINTEDLPGLGQRFRVNAIPTLVLFKGGREIARQSGALPAPAIRQFLQQAL